MTKGIHGLRQLSKGWNSTDSAVLHKMHFEDGAEIEVEVEDIAKVGVGVVVSRLHVARTSGRQTTVHYSKLKRTILAVLETELEPSIPQRHVLPEQNHSGASQTLSQERNREQFSVTEKTCCEHTTSSILLGTPPPSLIPKTPFSDPHSSPSPSSTPPKTPQSAPDTSSHTDQSHTHSDFPSTYPPTP